MLHNVHHIVHPNVNSLPQVNGSINDEGLPTGAADIECNQSKVQRAVAYKEIVGIQASNDNAGLLVLVSLLKLDPRIVGISFGWNHVLIGENAHAPIPSILQGGQTHEATAADPIRKRHTAHGRKGRVESI